jgi:hypothetical protein
MNKLKILFIHIGNTIINKDNDKLVVKNNNLIYKNGRKDGYYFNKEYYEIPLWIPRVCYFLPDNEFDKSLYIAKDLNRTVTHIINTNPDIILFSCMSANQQYVRDLVDFISSKTNIDVIVGTYIRLDYYRINNRVRVCNSLEDLAKLLVVDYKYGLDYSLFKNEWTVPRLTMSYGCEGNCTFCANIEHNNIMQVPTKDIKEQYLTFKNLKFELVYIDDKSWGDCNNYSILSSSFFNSKFIVQTNVYNVLNKIYRLNYRNCKIKYIELGIECYDNDILRAMNKIQDIISINKAIYTLYIEDVKIIPNIILGHPLMTIRSYEQTLNWLHSNKDKFHHININPLALYEGTKDYNIYNPKKEDGNQGTFDKSFLTKDQIELSRKYYNEYYKINKEILK